MAKRTQRAKDDASLTEAANRILETVSQLDGFDPFLAYLRELNAIREHLYGWDRQGLFPNRHLLISLNPGEGRSTLLYHLHAYLQQTRLFPNGRKSEAHVFGLHEKCFLDPVSNIIPEDTPFTDLESDMKYIHNGLIGLSMDNWPGRMDAPPVKKLMDWCREKQDAYLFVFLVPVLETPFLERLSAQLSEHLPIRLLQLAPATDEALTTLAVRKLEASGIRWQSSLNPLFRHLLIRERSDGRFHGRTTVMKLVTELQIARARNAVSEQADGPDWQASPRDFAPAAALWHPPEGQVPPTGMDRLNGLIGLSSVKQQLLEIITTMKVTRTQDNAADTQRFPRTCHHLLFTGGPGTGKTEVARIFGQILREEGLLPVGDLLETNRYDLVGQCLGHTGPRTMAVCQAAMGSVLFIDEAYQLAATDDAGASRDFGQEALGALIAEMENCRDQFIVILAGYREEMESLYQLNPGLRDRIPHHVHFPGYSREELQLLFHDMIRKKGIPNQDLLERVGHYLSTLSDELLASKEFGHARFIRNLVERTVIKGLMRSQTSDAPTLRLLATDFEQVLGEDDLQKLNRDRVRARIGF